MDKRSLGRAYQQQRGEGWSRVDMVLALYETTLARIAEAREFAAQGKQDQAALHRLRIVTLIAAIDSGLNLEHGEIPVNIHRLCQFATRCVADGSTENLDNAARVLGELRDAFRAIREQAAGLEAAGEIPPLDDGSCINTMA